MSATEPDRGRRALCLAVPGGEPCKNRPAPGLPFCREHIGPLERHRELTPREFLDQWRDDLERAVSRRLNRRPLKGNYDRDLVKALLPIATPLYNWYWRVEVHGVENIPTEGAALLASNHSGTLPLDGAMLKVAVLKEHGRNPWLLAGDLVFRIPGLAQITRTAGNARADREETLDLLRKGELVGVFPEGYKGIGKGFQKRYQLQRFGRGGFVEMAMEVGCPIIPVAIVGAEEAYPMIADIKPIANLFKLPYFPVTPFFPLLGPLGAIPLPSKWVISIGEPVPTAQFGPEGADDPQLVLETSESIRQTVQHMLLESLSRRRNAFL
ncbi:MAG: lysophospholipid acyltransferase family protein [Actinomycetota bacterium]|nr:acyltransferase family protein [Actinomycetota bacterium]